MLGAEVEIVSGLVGHSGLTSPASSTTARQPARHRARGRAGQVGDRQGPRLAVWLAALTALLGLVR